jgi:hypothetical protein
VKAGHKALLPPPLLLLHQLLHQYYCQQGLRPQLLLLLDSDLLKRLRCGRQTLRQLLWKRLVTLLR